jgi:soluble lytic murein transglycosylase
MTLAISSSRSLRRYSALATLVLAPALIAPLPWTYRHMDPLQAVAVGSARDAISTSRFDPWGMMRLFPHARKETASAEAPKATESPQPQEVSLTEPDVQVSAYAQQAGMTDPAALHDAAASLGLDLPALRAGLDAYRKGDVAAGDAIATRTTDRLTATALAWTWLRTHPREAGISRATQFIADHPDWPGKEWISRRIEDNLYSDRVAAPKVKAFFAARPPETPSGRIALARALLDGGDETAAMSIIRAVWAKDDFPAATELQIKKIFGERLTTADYKRRADRLMYKEDDSAALRVASLSGDKDLVAFERVRQQAANGPLSAKTAAAIPARYADDPALIFAKIQLARRADKTAEAAALMLSAPRDPALIVDGDEWWVERRLVARKLLDAQDYEKAYKISADHSAQVNEMKIEAEFHAGWIALRFLQDPARANTHFARLAALSQTPISKARAAYWQGRTAEAAGEQAQSFFEAAAAWPSTYYGQLARTKLGDGFKPAGNGTPAAEGNKRDESVRVIEALYVAGAKDLATSLATEAARGLRGEDQMKALARVVARDRDAKVSLSVGKLASYRGYALTDLAFPTYGVPEFTPLPNSAPLPVVYAIARQESAFDAKAMSGAGAMGLMQMIASTARRTAQRAGLTFDANRMIAEPTFNAQLGAAHLGDLLAEQAGSTILTFAAYNAGGKRVKEWISVYGDPRRADVDPVDWIERIPFTETRNYVQRVTENLRVYRARLADFVKPKPVPSPAPLEAKASPQIVADTPVVPPSQPAATQAQATAPQPVAAPQVAADAPAAAPSIQPAPASPSATAQAKM